MDRKVIRVTAPRKLEVFLEPVVEAGPHEMVIKTTVAGICRSDMPTYLGEASMQREGPLGFPCIVDSVPYPAAFGHELTGIVESVGSAVTRFAPGDRVSGACGGAFASRVTVSEFAPFAKLPQNVSAQNCLAEPIMCCCNIVHAARPPEGGSIAVVGCGYMGLATISLLHAYGIAKVAAFDIVPGRLEMAKDCGADHVFDPSDPDAFPAAIQASGGAGFDRVVELSKSLKGLLTAATLIKMPDETGRGVIAASSVYDRPEVWPTALGFELVCRCPELHFVHPGFIRDVPGLMREAVDAHSSGAVPQEGFITHRFAPEELGHAYESMMEGDPRYVKGAVVFDACG